MGANIQKLINARDLVIEALGFDSILADSIQAEIDKMVDDLPEVATDNSDTDLSIARMG